MSGYTEHYNLKKPAQNDGYNVDDANMNNEIIDEELYSKVDKIPGKGLSSNDFTNEYKKKVDALQTLYKFKGNVQSLQELQNIENSNIGDVYKSLSQEENYCWNGTEWISIGNDIDVSLLVESIENNTENIENMQEAQEDLQEELSLAQAKIDNLSSSYDMKKGSSGSTSNTYTLLARYTITGNYQDISDTIMFSKNMQASESTIVSIALRKDVGSNLNVNKTKYLSPKLSNIQFILVTNFSESTNTSTVDLYVYNAIDYTVITGKSLSYQCSSKTVTAKTYYTDQPNLTTLPAGNQHTITNYTLSSLELIGDYLDTPDYNQVVKSDNVCVVKFRGRVKNNISNATHIFNAPFSVAGRTHSVSARYGGRYEPNNQMFLYFTEFKKLNSQAISVGQYIHLDFTYICED